MLSITTTQTYGSPNTTSSPSFTTPKQLRKNIFSFFVPMLTNLLPQNKRLPHNRWSFNILFISFRDIRCISGPTHTCIKNIIFSWPFHYNWPGSTCNPSSRGFNPSNLCSHSFKSWLNPSYWGFLEFFFNLMMICFSFLELRHQWQSHSIVSLTSTTTSLTWMKTTSFNKHHIKKISFQYQVY